MSRRLRPSELSFDTVCKFLEKVKTSPLKQRTPLLQKFMALNIDRETGDAYSVFRLILPVRDSQRGNYKLLESRLMDTLLEACGYDKKSEVARQCKNWKKPGQSKAGDFAKVMEDTLFVNNCGKREGTPGAKELKVHEVNRLLDQLVEHAGKLKPQADVLKRFISMTTPMQMRWLVQIVLKNLRMGVGEGTLFKQWHEDAEEYYNNTGMDLEAVFNKMIDTGRMFKTAIQPGRVVRPQLARVALSAAGAFKSMQKKDGTVRPFVIETKFDGERIQVHLPGNDTVQYFSRQGFDHGEKSGYTVMDTVMHAQTNHQRCILDGEMIVYNKVRKQFEPFGSLKSTMNAVRDKAGGEELLDATEWNGSSLVNNPQYRAPKIKEVEIWYVAFDILFVDDKAVTRLTLEERYKLLKKAVKPEESIPLDENSAICGRIITLFPDETVICNDVLACRRAYTEGEIGAALAEATKNKEEGIVVKALDSPWVSNDRGSSWLKVKPDYVNAVDIDTLVIGGYYGEGKRGNMVTQYLVALAETPANPGEVPTRWKSFARIGSGMSDEEREYFWGRIKDNISEDMAHPPPEYLLTGLEKPDVWMKDPFKSGVIVIHADLRLIPTNSFRTKRSLRFPRIDCIRWDKDATMATTEAELETIIKERQQQSGKSEWQGKGGGRRSGKRNKSWGVKGERPSKRKRTVGAEHLPTNVSEVQRESEALSGALVFFANHGELGKSEAEKLVARLGGRTSMSWVPRVTHILVGRTPGKPDLGYAARQHISKDRDVITLSWLQQCAEEKRRVPLRPRHYIHISANTLQSSEDLDRYGDSYLSDVDASDVDLLLHEHMRKFALVQSDVAEGLSEESEEEWEGGGAPPPARGAMPSVKTPPSTQELLRRLDARLEAAGLLDKRFSLLRGCNLLLLDVRPPSSSTGADAGMDAGSAAPGPSSSGGGGSSLAAAAGSSGDAAADGLLYADVARYRSVAAELAADLRAMHARQLKAEARLHGAELAPAVTHHLTHLVCLVEDEDPSLAPGALLEAVNRLAGGPHAVAALRHGLGAGTIQLVTAGWLEESFEVLRQNPSTAERASEADHLLNLEDTHLEHWPWDRFAPPGPPPSAARGSASRPKRGAARARGGVKEEVVEVEEEGASSDLLPVQAPKRRGRAREASRAKAAAAAAAPSTGALMPPSLPALKKEPQDEERGGPASDAKPPTGARARPPVRRKQAKQQADQQEEQQAEQQQQQQEPAMRQENRVKEEPGPAEPLGAAPGTAVPSAPPPAQPAAALVPTSLLEAFFGPPPGPAPDAELELEPLVQQEPLGPAAAAAPAAQPALGGLSMFDLMFGSTMPAPPPAAPAEPAAAASLPATQPAASYLVPTAAAGSTEAAPMEEDVGGGALAAGPPAAAGPSQAAASQPAAGGQGTEGGAQKKLSLRERMALLRKG